MSNHSREKIALIVFLLLIVVSLCGLLGYLAVGHSWNVAASNIDDATGQMDGYTVIVYKGTVDPEAEKTAKSATPTAPGAPGADSPSDPSSGMSTLPKTSPVPASGTSKGELSRVNGEKQGNTNPPVSATGKEDDTNPDETDKKTLDDAAQSKKAPTDAVVDGKTVKKDPLTLEQVEESYLDKKATVFELDTENLAQYSEGTILMKGGHRFGVFSVKPLMSKVMIEREVEYFNEHEVDFIVALTPDKTIVENVSGIDIVISTQDEGLFVMGETIGGTFYVNAPSIGTVGVILISPSTVVSAKVIQEL